MTEVDTGRLGEDVAVEFLEKQGYQILERNYRFERHEVDIVCYTPAGDRSPGGEIVFVEVKTRSGDRFGRPEEAVNSEKQKKIVSVARAYLYERKLEGAACRFDVIGVVMNSSRCEIEHFEDAFWS